MQASGRVYAVTPILGPLGVDHPITGCARMEANEPLREPGVTPVTSATPYVPEPLTAPAAAVPSGRRQLALRVLDPRFPDLDVVEVVTADHDLVTVFEAGPLRALAVQEDAVQAAVVEHSHALQL